MILSFVFSGCLRLITVTDKQGNAIENATVRQVHYSLSGRNLKTNKSGRVWISRIPETEYIGVCKRGYKVVRYSGSKDIPRRVILVEDDENDGEKNVDCKKRVQIFYGEYWDKTGGNYSVENVGIGKNAK